MKNLVIGFIFGVIATALGMTVLNNRGIEQEALSKPISLDVQQSDKVSDITEIEQPVENKVVSQKIITTSVNSPDNLDIENMPADALKTLVRSYQAQVSGLTQAVKSQQEAIEKLKQEQERRRNPLEEQNLSPEQANAALVNIKEALRTAEPEYKEVLESALNLFDGEELSTPTNDALLRHYSDEPNVQWATSAQAWLQSYFQSGIEPDINLVQLNCRATYCELYGFYGSDNTIADYRAPAAKISNFFRAMSDGAGYRNLFRNAENISLNTSSDNTFMSFHVFIRSIG